MANLSSEIVIHDISYRPCRVKSRKGLFHKWITSDEMYVEIHPCVKQETVDRILPVIHDKHIATNGCEIKKITNTFALVEFEDGSVEKVRVEDIRFLDSRGRFESYSFEEE